MGDISCNCAFSRLVVVAGSGLADAIELDGTPQSSRSGRLSSSSAQSIWLFGVEGLWSIAKARTCSTSESMFVFVEEIGTVGVAERCGGAFFGGDALGCGDVGPERDLRAFTVEASAPVSDDVVAPDGLLFGRRLRVDILEEVVDAECGAEAAVGDAGSIVNTGSLSTACGGARPEPFLDLSGRSPPGSGWGSEDEEEFLLALEACEACDGADAIEGGDLVGFELEVGVFMLLSVVGEPRPLAPRVEAPPRRPPLPPRPRSLRLALLRPLFGPRTVELRSPVCPQSSRVEVGPVGGGMEREAMRV